MKLCEIVAEVLDSSGLDLSRVADNKDFQRWTLDLGDDHTVRFIAKWHGKEVMDFYFTDDSSGYHLSGKGGELKIFAAAKKILTDIIKERNPSVISFEADKTTGNSRDRLYRRFLQRWTPPGYEFKELSDAHSANFFIRKKDL